MLASLALTLTALGLLAVPASVRADSAWWEPLAFAGQRVSSVAVTDGRLEVTTATGRFLSTDGGRGFSRTSMAPPPQLPVTSAGTVWDVVDGIVYAGAAPAAGHLAVTHPVAGAPHLGAGAGLLAAPASAPGVVVTVGTDNHVWRRNEAGAWATAFIPLPAGGLAGIPRVTAVAAFTEPLTTAVYLGLDGYGVLLSSDGGDDWIRADPGLPENVLGLATDPAESALYAATDEGLFVHRLQSFPAPPVYTDGALALRWAGIGAVALLATLGALLALRRVLPGPPGRSR